MLEILNEIDAFVWGPPLLVLLVGTGILLTFRLKLLQVFKLPQALGLIFSAKNDGSGDVNSFKALCTALAATVGTGNIVGVATAIKAGGPGALFWMWLAAFFGMATKYAECLLAVKYRTVDANGNISGGPMYYIENGLGKKYKPLAVMFAIFGVLCAYFGIGTFAQVNSIVEITQISAGIPVVYTGIALTVVVAAVTIGGLKSIATVAAKVVPDYCRYHDCVCRSGSCCNRNCTEFCFHSDCCSRRFPRCYRYAGNAQWCCSWRILQRIRFRFCSYRCCCC